ncbi:MAG: hypothetical protein AUK47_12660 [Deltaproteobacteria bacterium CG2_30_63_29]|nr:MAG: hypothetical protein AUK47_12660 [Deltaproteobacteria bacterium CG2_30_63_29]PIV99549.1 MAG: hypothetical protein COW42_10695 [Deltaproteobacteria bacterium CG17_big_fil_post_rev_8_21_14_2_50_63_7]PJB41096.1 MAG: hypothetical protein CO108_13600 [Deltaproteobacteria bacterium CG_4_9_14_3_um_filter_63_12]
MLMLIDFFTYTNATEGGQLSAAELIAGAAACSLDGICITDREYSSHAKELLAAAETSKVFVGLGVELEVEGGLLVCFPSRVDGFLFNEDWRELTTFGTPSAQEVIDFMNARDGAVIARNVFQREALALGDSVFRLRGLAGIDALNPLRRRIENELALEAATSLGVAAVAGSGAMHSLKELGKAATLMGDEITTQEQLVATLQAAEVWPTCLDARANWAPTGGQGGGGSQGGGRPRTDGPRGRRDSPREGRGDGPRDRRGGSGGGGGGRGRRRPRPDGER